MEAIIINFSRDLSPVEAGFPLASRFRKRRLSRSSRLDKRDDKNLPVFSK
jgi:hypothetical protein